MWKSDLGGSLTSEFLCCVVTCHVKSLSLILVDFWEGQGWVGVGGVWFEFLSVKSIVGW